MSMQKKNTHRKNSALVIAYSARFLSRAKRSQSSGVSNGRSLTRRMPFLLTVGAAILFLVGVAGQAKAQPAPGGIEGAWYPAGPCGTVAYTATASPRPITVDGSGYLCITGSVTVGTTTGVAPAASTSLEATHVFKAAAGSVYSVSATKLTGGTAGYLLLLNATAAPGDGAVTPLACAPFNSLGDAIIQYTVPAAYSTGVTAVVTSATTCLTKTTGVLTAFLQGQVQ